MSSQNQDRPRSQGDGNKPKSAGSVRPPVAAMEKGPGPATCSLPQNVVYEAHGCTKFRNPAWSMKGKHGKFSDDCSPGPKYGLSGLNGALTNKGVHRSQSFTISGRNRELSNLMKDTPGPGANTPQIDFDSKHRAPQACSMGSRRKYKLGDDNPAPNSYGLPTVLGPGQPQKTSSACYSLHGRLKTGAPDEDLGKTPGPARYGCTDNEIRHRSNPRWTFSGRQSGLRNMMDNPAPNSYSHYFPNKKSIPKFSMGIRHSEYVMPLITNCDY